MIQKLSQQCPVEALEKACEECLDHGDPLRVGRRNPCAWVQKFYQNRGGILVLAVVQGSRLVAVVFRHGVSLSEGRPNVEAWNCLIFVRPALAVKAFYAVAKKCNARAKKSGGRMTICYG